VPSAVGSWTGKLVNTTVGASYDYRVVLAAGGAASVTNEASKTVTGGWTAAGREVTLGFLINANNVVMKGQLADAGTYSGTWSVTGKPDFGTFNLQRN
jgi:hypothetical protein